MRIWRDLSIAKKLYIVIGTMAVLVAIELLSLTFAMRTLTAVRAFVGGESLWSKAQKDATLSLSRFAITKDPKEYSEFLKHLRVSQGDRQARLELEKPDPDLNRVRDGFLAGGIHPEDIDSLVYLFRRFSWEPHVARAVVTWVEGDRLIMELEETGRNYYRLLTSPKPDTSEIKAAFDRLQSLNERLTKIEAEFSSVLGEGARWLETVVNTILLLLVLTVETIGLTLTFLTSRSISRGLAAINQTAHEIGRGNFTKRVQIEAKDEIGQLGDSINQMGVLLQETYKDLERRVQERTAELSELANENARLYKKAHEAVLMRDEFLSVASHELKTPLTALQLRFQVLKRGLTKTPPEKLKDFASDLVDAALRDTRRLGRLLQELLDLTRIRLGKFDVKPEPGDLSSVALDVARQFGEEAAAAGCQLTVDAPEIVSGNFDLLRLNQVATNLVSNAIKYGSGKPIQIRVWAQDGTAFLEVKDRGRGISNDLQSRLFERFERGEAASDGVAGTGLGLYITRQIVLAHGGDISFESTQDVGSTFTASIPRDTSKT